MGCALMQGVVEDAPPMGSPVPHISAAAPTPAEPAAHVLAAAPATAKPAAHVLAAAPAPAEPATHVPAAAPAPAEHAALQTSVPGMVTISLVMLSCFAKLPQLDVVTKCDEGHLWSLTSILFE